MCEIIQKVDSLEVREGVEQSVRAIRWKPGEEIARRFARESLKHWEGTEKDLFSAMREIAEDRGERPPSFESTRRREREKVMGQGELLAILAEAISLLGEEEVALLQRIFDNSAPGMSDIFERQLGITYQAGLDYSYERMQVTARPQDPIRFQQVSPIYPFQPNSSFVQAFLSEALQRVTAKISVQFKGQAIQLITQGLNEGLGWSTIASNIHNTVGMGAKWHWERLVRTEMGYAYHHSSRERATDAGVGFEKLSISRTACPVCVDAQGWYRLGSGPRIPLHPNCRCVWVHAYRLPKGAVVRG